MNPTAGPGWLRRAFGIVVLVALAVIPLLYSGLLVWANADPTKHLDRVDAAIVNEDRGAAVTSPSGTATDVHLGDDLVDRLTDPTSADPGTNFTWIPMDAETAAADLADGSVLAVVTVPSGFSADATSSITAAPSAVASSGAITLTTNDASNFLIGSIAKSVSTAVTTSVAQGVTAEQLKGLLLAFGDVHESISDAATGAGRLAAGASTAHDGAQALTEGLRGAAAGADSASSGAAALSTGASKLAAGTPELESGAANVADGIDGLVANYALLDDAHRIALLTQLEDGAREVADGAAQANAAAGRLASGAGSLAQGAAALDAGIASAATGAASLASGTAQLADGASQLASQLGDGADSIPVFTEDQAAARAATAAAPVTLDAVRENAVGTNGAGLAPYFMSLGLWIGALGTFLMRPALDARLLGRRRIPAPLVALRSFWPAAVLGLAQALLVALVGRLWLGVPAADAVGLTAFAVLTSVTFMAINQALIALLGPTGRFLALLLVVLQLSSAGGTYPVQTSDPFFQAVHGALPLDFAVQAFRSLIAGGDLGVAQGGIVLACWLVGALAVATLGAFVQRRRLPSDALVPIPIEA